MQFLVTPPGRVPRDYKGFILRQDNWNDYSFQTLYQLYMGTTGEPELIGNVKILRIGQLSTDSIQLSVGLIEDLGENFCSVGQDLDYYERLSALGPETRDSILNGLRDIVKDPTLEEKFGSEEGWRVSLFRNFPPDAAFLGIARALISRDYSSLPKSDLAFSFHPTGWGDPLELKFSPPASRLDLRNEFAPSGQEVWLPSRIAVLVGRNGSGKSTLLARLARVAHASAGERQTRRMKLIGELEPAGLGFTRIVAISYSAFDSFTVPGTTREERGQIAKEIRSGVGRYMFCGLRDIALEIEETPPEGEPASKSDDGVDDAPSDRLPSNKIKSLEQLSDEFVLALQRIEEKRRKQIFRRCTASIFLDPSLHGSHDQEVFSFLGDDPREKFHMLSTGHKICLHVIASVVSHAERQSLILFDEPETHLHPPLLAALMDSLRLSLQTLECFAIVATHSPVVVQETLGRHVHKVVRYNEGGAIQAPIIETFGENIGAITSEVFSLDANATDFHTTLRILVDEYQDLDQIEAVFDRGLSSQARAYVLSLLAAKDSEKA